MKVHRTMPLPVKSVGPLVRPKDHQNHGPCSSFVSVSSYQLPLFNVSGLRFISLVLLLEKWFA